MKSVNKKSILRLPSRITINRCQYHPYIKDEMKTDSELLKTFRNFGKMKNISRQRIYKLVEAGRFDTIEIDQVKFIILKEKSIKYKKQF